MKITPIKVTVLAMALAIAGGCANTTQIDEIRSIAESAQSTANNAASQASSALSTANQALSAARNAQSAAKAAQDCCNANTTKIDRAFEQMMAK
ncbi:MAG: Lpp/OprI family alanine-zipper lipoprotein [Gammaproteobacteria bacterium]